MYISSYHQSTISHRISFPVKIYFLRSRGEHDRSIFYTKHSSLPDFTMSLNQEIYNNQLSKRKYQFKRCQLFEKSKGDPLFLDLYFRRGLQTKNDFTGTWCLTNIAGYPATHTRSIGILQDYPCFLQVLKM